MGYVASVSCNAVRHFRPCNHLAEDERAANRDSAVMRLFLFCVSSLSCRGSVVCQYGISWSYSATFCSVALPQGALG